MARKVLFTATLVRGHIAKFHIPYLKWFKEQGWETWVAAKNDYPDGVCEIPYCDHFVEIDFARSPFSAQTIDAYRELRSLFNAERFDLIHTHTPVGSVLTRLAARNMRKAGTKLIYTAHGFHFYTGAPISSWLLWYPVEAIMSRFADCIITINREDFDRAKRFCNCDVEYVPGVGIDVDRFVVDSGRLNVKQSLGLPEASFVLVSVGDLNVNKNHKVLVRALKELDDSVYLLVAGDGPEREKLQNDAKVHGVDDRVLLLGFWEDIPQLLSICDVFCFPSKREGLPVSVIEAMASGKPCVVSNCRGATELIDQWDEFVIYDDDPRSYATAIQKLRRDALLRKSFADDMKKASAKYSLPSVLHNYSEIYDRVMKCQAD